MAGPPGIEPGTRD